MSLLVESIRIENKRLHHIGLHNNRFNNARKALFGATDFVHLENLIQIPNNISGARYKCRVTTNGHSLDYETDLYKQREVKSLKLVEFNNIDYTYKTDDRLLLDTAYSLRGNCDDIIIVKNKLLTDAWAANIILFDGNEWVTPSTPLLKGIQREYLLSIKLIKAKTITVNDLQYFEKIKLINALIDFERSPEIDIQHGLFQVKQELNTFRNDKC